MSILKYLIKVGYIRHRSRTWTSMTLSILPIIFDNTLQKQRVESLLYHHLCIEQRVLTVPSTSVQRKQLYVCQWSFLPVSSPPYRGKGPACVITTLQKKLSYLCHRGKGPACVITTVQREVMVFNATFNNISVISWLSVLLVEETQVPGENHQPAICHHCTEEMLTCAITSVQRGQSYLCHHLCIEETVLPVPSPLYRGDSLTCAINSVQRRQSYLCNHLCISQPV